LREIPDASVSMLDMLNLLEKLRIIDDVQQWDRLREIRNAIAHEYPSDIQERVDNIHLALSGFESLQGIFEHIKAYILHKNT
jgi:uncharacterized protein with HEPN domain